MRYFVHQHGLTLIGRQIVDEFRLNQMVLPSVQAVGIDASRRWANGSDSASPESAASGSV